jgi:hypothetical protein
MRNSNGVCSPSSVRNGEGEPMQPYSNASRLIFYRHLKYFELKDQDCHE